MKAERIALGTAQFGLDYGINNTRGRIPAGEAHEILKLARLSDIDTLDTAGAYGDSQKTIGDFIRKEGGAFKIISKVPKKYSSVGMELKKTLAELSIDSLYGYLFHDFESYKQNPSALDELKRLNPKTQRIGFSLYKTEELEYLFEQNIYFDIVQFPYSVLDRRFEKYFGELKTRGIEIHTRSVFLQGLLFRKPDELAGKFARAGVKIAGLRKIADKNGIPLHALYLNFALADEKIDRVVVGVDNIGNFKEIIGSLAYYKKVEKIRKELQGFQEDELDMILPTRWVRVN